MTVRDASQYIERLRSHPRQVWLHGKAVQDVTTHPALRRPIARIADLYDMQQDTRERELLVVDGPDGPIARAFEPPRSLTDLRLRRGAFQARAEAGFGLFGRMPEFVHTTLLAFRTSPELFGRLGPRFADNVEAYFSRVRDEDLFVVPALTPPQIDRSLPPSAPEHARSHLAVVERTGEGLVVRGARMLSSLAPIADELLIYSPPVLRPGDEDHAAVFAVAVDTPGVRLICRTPFDDGDLDPASHPLAAHFEEPDALVVFDDVLVPWERVFLHGSVELSNGLHRGTVMRELVGHQTGARALVRMELVAGVAMKIAETIKVDGQLHIQQRLGDAVAVLEQARALLVAAEAEHGTTASGIVYPKLSYMQALRVLIAREYPRLVENIQVLGAGGLMMRPSPEDVVGERAEDVEVHCRGAAGVSAAERLRLYNVAWDLAGEAFGQRGVQFERYGGGDPMRVTAGGYLGYDKSRCIGLVERAMAMAGR
jgi:anthranilate 3-monooxygenase (FAD)/4-hydroxyphenylacetate 3-monooxygenase